MIHILNHFFLLSLVNVCTTKTQKRLIKPLRNETQSIYYILTAFKYVFIFNKVIH